MNTVSIHIIIASCLLIAAGIASFPYRLSYGNTFWLPRCMRPDKAYLDRPYEYNYPARNINLLFSVSVAVAGVLALIFTVMPHMGNDVPTEIWFRALAILYPAYAVCQVLFWRRYYDEGFCYADRLTSFSYCKVYAVLLTVAAVFILHLTGILSLSIYRVATTLFSVLSGLFLIYDYIRVFRLRSDNEYCDPIGIKEMYPESLSLIGYPLLAVPLVLTLWGYSSACAAIFGILLLMYTVARYVFRFHPAISGDERERWGNLWYWKRHVRD